MRKHLYELDIDTKDSLREFFYDDLNFLVEATSETGTGLYVYMPYFFANQSSISDGSAGHGLNNQVCAGFEYMYSILYQV